jgi:deoxyadenosine/deoxycytidine kinase
MNTVPKICCIDGNIGAGKSTILNHLKENGYVIFEEDLSNWGSLLSLFYEDPKRWMCTFQIKILISMNNQYERMRTYKGAQYVFVERSPISSMIFVENGVNSGFLTKEEENLIKDIYSKLRWKPDINFYINTNVDTCYSRMRSRDRECEKDVNKEYLEFLHESYIKTYNSEDIRDCSYIINGIPPVVNVVNKILETLEIK